MAITYVGGKTATFAGTTSAQNISLTNLTGGAASAPAQDDIVIVAYGVSGVADRSIGVNTAGYTEEQELYSNGAGPDANLSVSWKFMGASPDTTVQVTGTGDAAEAGAVAIHVWRGVDLSTPFDVAETTATGTGTDRPDPASITPTTSGAIIIACGCGANLTGSAFTSSDLSNFVTAASSDDNDATIGMGSIAWTSGAVDAAQFGGNGGAQANRSWAAVTLALRPGPFSASTGLSTETDASISLSARLSAGAGRANEANLAQSLAMGVRVGLASEADVALALSARISASVGRADETDTASNLRPVLTVGLANEAETALSLSPRIVIAVGVSDGADIALALAARLSAQTGQAEETDAALALSMVLAGAVGLATETSTSQSLGLGQAFFPANEDNQAPGLPLPFVKYKFWRPEPLRPAGTVYSRRA